MNRLLTGDERIKIYEHYMEGQPDKIEPECEFAYLQEMLKAQDAKSYKAGRQDVVDWFRQYATHGGGTRLSTVLEDLRIHSPYGNLDSKPGE